MRGRHRIPAGSLAVLVTALATSASAAPCAPGATCMAVRTNGAPDPQGPLLAQCSGSYPDYIDLVPATSTGPFFKLAQSYPPQPPAGGTTPWTAHDFMKASEADAYMAAVRAYVYDGMLQADWRAEKNTVRQWYHVPWMTAGPRSREFLRGMTQERSVRGPELGLKPGTTVQNWAIGYYNDVGGATVGKVWADPAHPDGTKGQFAEGTVVVKVLFSAAKATDFSADDILAGAPEWDANIQAGSGKTVGTVRLLQMDVAVRDGRAPITGWVFGTFAYDKNATGANGWEKMVPVGLMWGNDPTVTQPGQMKEGIVSTKAPAYAKSHLGWLGRVNGPVDNPVSACMSCHSTAQFPQAAPITPGGGCTVQQKLRWFRNISGSTPFGGVQGCQPSDVPGLVALDYSLQLAVSLRAFDSGDFENPCPQPAPAGGVEPQPDAMPHPKMKAPKTGPRPYDIRR